ncbi:TPA: hypothetical protein QHD00_004175 [Enterobacter cloacae subsp. cloacae]|nr:hypothetical protein [Enterobacter cloacae subsp. cloacae]
MKKIILATAIALSTTSAFAAGTAVIKVKGTLTNAACTAELGKVRISRSFLPKLTR